MAPSPQTIIKKLVRKKGVLRSRELAELGVPRTYLRRMVEEGILANPERGIYVLASAKPNLHQSLLEASARVPRGVICLLSALQFHGLTTQSPFEVWMAIGESARHPKVQYPPLRIVRFSKATLEYGVEKHEIDGIKVSITSPAKTVADCYKYRHKIGLDVAIEALRDCWRNKKATIDEIYHAAEVCRVARVIRPYLESLV